MAEGAANRLPMFVAIYCRPEGEVYDEKVTMQRANVFGGLTMDMVWRVFFCIYRQLGKSLNYTQGYLKNVGPVLAARLGTAD